MKKSVIAIASLLLTFVIGFTAQNLVKQDINNKVTKAQNESYKMDSPQIYAQYYHDIRTRNGETNPTYSRNYKIKELLKARHVKSTKDLASLQNTELLDWIERGPGNVSGRTRTIAVDPRDATASTWFAGSVGGGVWKTTNSGSSWTEMTKGIPNLATSIIAMAQSNPDVLYVGTGEGYFNVDEIDGSGIWKTTDGGLTWTQLPQTATRADFQNVMRMFVDPSDENIVVVATAPGFNGGATKSKIMKTTDGGTTWTQKYSSSSSIQDLVPTPGNFNVMYATVNATGVIKSVNAGDSWSNSSSGISNVGRLEIDVSPVNTNNIFISAEGGSTGSMFYFSTNAGSSWTGVQPSENFLGGQGWYDNTIVAHPYNENACFLGGVNIWRVDITGSSTINLTNITDGYGQFGGSSKGVHVDQHELVAFKTNEATQSYRLLNGNDGGVAFSDNEGTTFTTTKNGYNTTQFYGADKMNGSNRYVGGMQDNNSWMSNVDPTAGSGWSFKWGGDGYEAAWKYDDPNKILVSSQYNNVGISTNGGSSFTSATTGMDDKGSGKAPFFTKIAKSKQDADLIFLMGQSGVWRSGDFTSSWRNIPVPGSIGGTSTFSQIKISLVDPQIVWTGSNVSPNSSLMLSQNGGFNFEEVNGYGLVNMGRITGLETHPTDRNTAYALFSFASAPKILRTTDLGQNWEDISGFGTNTTSSNGFPDVATFSLLVMPYDTNIIWAGTEIGIFQSTDNGGSWSYLSSSLPAVAVYDMIIVNDQVVVSTHGRGVWSVTLSELSGYEPPDVALAPILYSVSSGTTGIDVHLNLREVYDSTQILVDGLPVKTITNSATGDITVTVNFAVNETKTYHFSGLAFSGTSQLQTEVKDLDLFSFENPQTSYKDDFATDQGNFLGDGFSIKREFAFQGNWAIHSKHPYDDDNPITYTLKVPVTVSAGDAFLNYKDIAIVEPGDNGTVFGDANFFDYVVVEGTKDGMVWTPLADGYDARYDPDWLAAYTAGSAQYFPLYRSHSLDLKNTFSAGDVILIRFRLFSDPLENGWGWAIDDLEVQDYLVGVNDEVIKPIQFSLNQNYPNPFNPSTTISYSLPINSKVQLSVFNVLGEKVAELLNKDVHAGIQHINWDAGNNASGIYFYKISAFGENGKKFSDSKKMILLR